MSGAENPPAFPQRRYDEFGHAVDAEMTGMSLRDWFAGQALSGFIAMLPNLRNVQTPDGGPIDEEKIAISVYGIADAMLAERERTSC